MAFEILLYYKFVPVPDPEQERNDTYEVCKRLGLKGRIIIAPEGLNGTVSGTAESCGEFRAWMHEHPLWNHTEFKIDPHDGHAFKRLSVKARAEVVTLGQPCEPWVQTGPHLEPAEFRKMLEESDPLILDIRNDYEYEIGRFKGAVRPPVKTFKEFPEWLAEVLPKGSDRPVLTYCTGGIRCEKLTAYLIDQGIENVYQLKGGIVTYGKDPATRGAHWEGMCYVFDDRVTVPVGDHVIPVTRCVACQSETARYVNCSNVDCNKQYVLCEACETNVGRTCSEACAATERQREPNAKLALELRSERIRLRRQAWRHRRKARQRAERNQCAAEASSTVPENS
jgi:UPF0176 protein